MHTNAVNKPIVLIDIHLGKFNFIFNENKTAAIVTNSKYHETILTLSFDPITDKLMNMTPKNATTKRKMTVAKNLRNNSN